MSVSFGMEKLHVIISHRNTSFSLMEFLTLSRKFCQADLTTTAAVIAALSTICHQTLASDIFISLNKIVMQ